LDVFIDGFAYFSLFPYIIYDHLKCVSRPRATLNVYSICYEYLFVLEYYWGDEIKKNAMGGACGAGGRKKRAIQGFGVET